jgi:exonuclease SbcD
VRFGTVSVDASSAASGHDVVDVTRQGLERALASADGRPLAARVVLHGSTRAHAALTGSPEQYTNEIRLAATDVGGAGVFVEKVVIATRGTTDSADVRRQNDAVGDLARSIQEMRADPDKLRALLSELSDLRQKLPLELTEGEGALSFDEAHLAAVLSEVEAMLIPRLLAKEPAR